MTETDLPGDTPLSRFELGTLQRLRELAKNHPPAPRPGIRSAVSILLDAAKAVPAGGISVKLPARSLQLLPRRVFRSNGETTAAVELFALRDAARDAGGSRMIRKRIQRQAMDVANIGWLLEALFYLDVAPQLVCEGIRVPRIYGCSADDGAVTLVMEFLRNNSAEVPAADRLRRIARSIGRLGAYTHLHSLYERPWAQRVTHRLNVEALLALEQLVRHSLPGAEGDRCFLALEDFINDPQLHQTLSEQGIACLVHGDMNPWNVFPMADGEVGIIDWSYVGWGLIGEDLARLMLPQFVSHPIWADQPDFSQSVRVMTEEVIAGAKTFLPSLDEERVRIAVARSLLLAVGNVAGQNPEVSKRKLADGDHAFRAKLQSVFRFAAENARVLAERFGH